MVSRNNPLNWNAAIVNPNGTPTKEFMTKWALQARLNDIIPALSTPAQVSSVIDVLGDDRGDMLRRGATLWETFPTPSDATMFLSGTLDPAWSAVHDSDLSLSDITDNDVSITAHGFAPKAPNDATMYLDGTGAYSVPAGGGGGGGAVTLLDSGTVSAAATFDLDFNAYLGAYPLLQLELLNFVPVTNNVQLNLRIGTGSPPVYQTGGSDYQYASLYSYSAPGSGADGAAASSTTAVTPGASIGNAAIAGVSATFKSANWSAAASRTRWRWETEFFSGGSLLVFDTGGTVLNQAAAGTGLRIYFSSGNIASGEWRLLGVA